MLDPLLRRIKYETGALVALYKPYAERYIGILEGLLENPPEETPGWHASELETSQVMAHDARLVRMDRAADDRAQAPSWLPESLPEVRRRARRAVRGLPVLHVPDGPRRVLAHGRDRQPDAATAEKGEEALERFSDHLARAIDEFRGAGRARCTTRAFEERV